MSQHHASYRGFYRGFTLYTDDEKNVCAEGHGKLFIVKRYRVLENKPTIEEAVKSIKSQIDLWHIQVRKE